jgi:OPA family glycerol-3-phosphate transporter-like MFS transporter
MSLSNPRLMRRWRRITLITLFVGYMGYYLCRSDLAVAKPLMLAEPGLGLTKESLGTIDSIGVLAYAVGKIVNGVLADRLGGRALFLGGMGVAAACSVAFGRVSGLGAFAAIWAVNRFAQAGGWPALVAITGRWFPRKSHATVLGVLSMSYLLGDAIARFYLGAFLRAGVSWRGLFEVAAATLAMITLVAFVSLRSGPKSVGLQEADAPTPDEGLIQSTQDTEQVGRRVSLKEQIGPLLASGPFWLICAVNVGLTLIRETFNLWTPTFLREAAGIDPARAAWGSLFFPLVGAVSAVTAGWLSDRLGGRRDRVMVPSLLLLIASLVLLGTVPVQGKPLVAVALTGLVAFFLIGPYSYLAGVSALDLGGRRSAATASGLIDTAGYLGAILSGIGVAALAGRYGWSVAFLVLAGIAAGTTVLAAIMTRRATRAT